MPALLLESPMLIDCPACARSYHVSRAEIGEDGRTVICPRCDAWWFVDGDGTVHVEPAEDVRAASVSRRPETIDPGVGPEPCPSIWHRARPFGVAAICVIAAMGSLGAREHVVRLIPRTAGVFAAIGLPVNVRGLAFAAVVPARLADTSLDVTVSGEIRNVAKSRVGVPRLTYEIRDAAGAPLVTWTERAPARTLASGRTLPFVSAPHRLPAEAQSILVRFEGEEAVAPTRLVNRSAH